MHHGTCMSDKLLYYLSKLIENQYTRSEGKLSRFINLCQCFQTIESIAQFPGHNGKKDETSIQYP